MNNKIFKEQEDNIFIKRIKELINFNEIKYISASINQVLDLKFTNNDLCFKEYCQIKQDDEYRVTLYIRLSVEDGDLIDGDISKSIKNQLLLLLDEAKLKKWIVVGIFCDEDYSGTDDNRPEWNLLLKFAENKWTDIVLSKTQSRFTRSMEMVEKYLHNLFLEWQIRFVSIVDRADTFDKANKKQRQITALKNEWDLEDQSENTKKTLRTMKQNGQFTGSFAPYGYKKDPEDKYHLIIDENVSKHIKMIFRLYKQGKGYHYITKILTEKKIPTPSEYKRLQGSKYKCPPMLKHKKINWNIDTIRKILMDEVYIGTLVQGKREKINYKNKKQRAIPKAKWIRVPNCHEPVIDLNTWKTVKQRFIGRSKPTKTKEIHIFSQKVYCSCCQKSFHRNVYKTINGKRAYLQCRTNRKTFGTCDNKTSINLQKLEEIILKEINKQIKINYDLNILQKKYLKQNTSNNNELKILEKEKSELLKLTEFKSSIFTNLYDDKIQGIISQEEFIILKKKYSDEISEYNERVLQINNELKEILNKQNKQTDIKLVFNKYQKGFKKLDRIILNEFISKIIINKPNLETKTRSIKLIWNIY